MGSDTTDKDRRSPGRPLILVCFIVAVVGSYFIFAAAFGRGEGVSILTKATGTDAAGELASAAVAAAAQPRADMIEVQAVLEARVCGSPAVDGYAHVKPECLETSPTNLWWQVNKPKPDDLDIHIERGADYDGLAVGWGIGNTKTNVEECAEACRQHVPKGPSDGPFGTMPCNAFAFCAEPNCFEPDAHKHSQGDCWLKFTEGPASPEVNMRGRLSKAMQQRHPQAPAAVAWHAGVLLPRGVLLRNGSWSPRHNW